MLREPHSQPAKRIESNPAITMAPAKVPVREARPQRPRFRTAATSVAHESTPMLVLTPEVRTPGWMPEATVSPPAESSIPPVETVSRRAPPVESSATIRPSLSGEWLFVASPNRKSSGVYPPEYIELRVSEEAGIVRGR